MADQIDSGRAELHDFVRLNSSTPMAPSGSTPAQGRVTAVDQRSNLVTVEFPNQAGLAPMTIAAPADAWVVVRKAAADELAQALREVDRLRDRLEQIGTFASDEAAFRWGNTVTAQVLQRIARMARRGHDDA